MNTNREPLQKQTLNRINVLTILLSEGWGTKERHVLNDCLIAKEAGAKVYIYCYRDTVVDIQAKKLGINCFYHQGKASTKLFKWNKLALISKLIKQYNINLVHVYDIKFLWPMAYFLRSDQHIPLFFTLGNSVKKSYRKFWFRTLISRVDQVLMPYSQQEEDIATHMGIPPRKISFCGMGIRELPEGVSQKLHIADGSSSRLLGMSIGGQEREIKFLRPLLLAIKSINDSLKHHLKLLIVSEKEWSTIVFYKELKDMIWELGLGNDVQFVDEKPPMHYQKNCDLWVGLPRKEELEDHCLEAIFSGIPVVMPRTVSSTETLRWFGPVAETYRMGDSRELRSKIMKVLTDLESYKRQATLKKDEFSRVYGFESYRERLLQAYNQKLAKRARFTRRQLSV